MLWKTSLILLLSNHQKEMFLERKIILILPLFAFKNTNFWQDRQSSAVCFSLNCGAEQMEGHLCIFYEFLHDRIWWWNFWLTTADSQPGTVVLYPCWTHPISWWEKTALPADLILLPGNDGLFLFYHYSGVSLFCGDQGCSLTRTVHF